MLTKTVINILSNQLKTAIPETLAVICKLDRLELEAIWDDCLTHVVPAQEDSETRLFRLLTAYFIYQRSVDFPPQRADSIRRYYIQHYYPLSGDPEQQIDGFLQDLKDENRDFYVDIIDAAKEILFIRTQNPYRIFIDQIISGEANEDILNKGINFVFFSQQVDPNRLVECFDGQANGIPSAPSQSQLLFLQLVVCYLHKTEVCTDKNRELMKPWADAFLYNPRYYARPQGEPRLYQGEIANNASEYELLYGLANNIFGSENSPSLTLAYWRSFARLASMFHTSLGEEAQKIYDKQAFLYNLVQVVPVEPFDFKTAIQSENADEVDEISDAIEKTLDSLRKLIGEYLVDAPIGALESDCAFVERTIGAAYPHLSFWSYLTRKDTAGGRLVRNKSMQATPALEELRDRCVRECRKLVPEQLLITASDDVARFREFVASWIQSSFNQAVVDRLEADFERNSDESFVLIMITLLGRSNPDVPLDECLLIKFWESWYHRIYDNDFFHEFVVNLPCRYALDQTQPEESTFFPSWDKFNDMLICNRRDNLADVCSPNRLDLAVSFVGLPNVGKTCMRASTLLGFDDPDSYAKHGFRFLQHTIAAGDVDDYLHDDVRPTQQEQIDRPEVYCMTFRRQGDDAKPSPVPAVVAQLDNDQQRVYLHFVDTAGEDFSPSVSLNACPNSWQALEKVPIVVVVLDASMLVKLGMMAMNTIGHILQHKNTHHKAGQIVIFALNKTDLLEPDDWPNFEQDVFPGGMPLVSEDVSKEDLLRIIFSKRTNNSKVTIQKTLLHFVRLFELMVAGKGRTEENDFNQHQNRLINLFWTYSTRRNENVASKLLPENIFDWVYSYLRRMSPLYLAKKKYDDQKRRLIWGYYHQQNEALKVVHANVDQLVQLTVHLAQLRSTGEGLLECSVIEQKVIDLEGEINSEMERLQLCFRADADDKYEGLKNDIRIANEQYRSWQLELYKDEVNYSDHSKRLPKSLVNDLTNIETRCNREVQTLASRLDSLPAEGA